MSFEDVRDLLEFAMKAGSPQVASTPFSGEGMIVHKLTSAENAAHYFQESAQFSDGKYLVRYMGFELPSADNNYYCLYRFGFEDLRGNILWMDTIFGTSGFCVLDVQPTLWLRRIWFRVESLPSIRQGDTTTYPWASATLKMYYVVERVV